ncbi:hypothetical protein SOV_09640 [Sporomusa ovata DSM 2662]|nr:hypothetical protein [Sporomusa ovata]EQB28613.1 hypothetical protein SOV_1c03020 [Sporomusa ovata DSM 2662]
MILLSTTWLYLMVVMIVGSIVKGFVFGQIIWVSIDLAVLGVCYLILRRRYWVDMRQSMIFLSVITVISILADIGLISGMFANVLSLAFIGWLIYRGSGGEGKFHNKKPKLRHKWHK